MNQRLAYLTWALLLSQLWAGVALAGEVNEDAALRWLQKIVDAARQLNYTGDFVYQRGEQRSAASLESWRIIHFADGGVELEKLETLDGPRREIYRNKDEILTLDFGARSVRREQNPMRKGFPALLPQELSALTECYRLRKAGQERIAGYDSQSLILEPRDQYRYGHQLWAEIKTGLLLKARMTNEQGHVVEQFVFTRLDIGGAISRKLVEPPSNAGPPPPPDNPGTAHTGWTVLKQPAGFRKILEVSRRKEGAQSPIAHLVYSDGLAAVSVFIEPVPGLGQRRLPDGWSQHGAVNIYTKSYQDQLVTVLGETPYATVKQVADSVSRSK